MALTAASRTEHKEVMEMVVKDVVSELPDNYAGWIKIISDGRGVEFYGGGKKVPLYMEPFEVQSISYSYGILRIYVIPPDQKSKRHERSALKEWGLPIATAVVTTTLCNLLLYWLPLILRQG